MRTRLKIAQIITRLERGGSSDVVIALCERLDRERFDLTLITGPSADPAEEPRRLVERLGIGLIEEPGLIRAMKPLIDFRELFALRAALEKLRPDVVHTHTSKAGALGRIAAKLAGDIAVVHSPHGHLFYGYYGKVGTGLVVGAERMLAPLAKVIAVLTDTSRAEHLARGVGVHGQYRTIPSAIDLGRFKRDAEAGRAIRAELGLTAVPGPRRDRLRQLEPFVIGWVGRFTAVKAPDVFIEACAHVVHQGDLPEVAFVLAGDGELRMRTEAQARKLGIADRCRFLGHREDVPAVLNACDLFVLSSRNEGLGLAAVEAMACGVPVIATDVGGLRELLEDGRSGVLVAPGESAAIAAAVISLAYDERRRTELVLAGLKRATHFDLAAMVERFAEVYEELAACSA